MNRWRLVWFVWLALFPIIEIAALLRLTIWKDREARTLTQIVEPSIRANAVTRAIFWIAWAALGAHLGTGWF